MVATLGRVLLTLTDGLSTRTMGDDGGYNDDDDDEVDDNDDNVDGDDDGDNGDLIEGQEGRKWTSSLRSIFHFMLCKVWGFPLEHQPSANNMRMWWTGGISKHGYLMVMMMMYEDFMLCKQYEDVVVVMMMNDGV